MRLLSLRNILIAVIVIGVVVAGGLLAYAMRHPSIAAIARPAPSTFPAAVVKHGEELAGIGNCSVCHTKTGGPALAGGLALDTPFGIIHTSNITPDEKTGIGTWSEAAFIRAMREGVDRDGHYLYPAFPYDYFTRTTDEDLKAIYAYLMTRPPVVAEEPPNTLGFPFNVRLLMAGWNMLYLSPGPFQPDASKDKEWNRGAYLVESLGHCGACHSNRNVFGAAAKSGPDLYNGWHPEGWYAPPLNKNSPSPTPWTVNALANYLIDGWDKQHGIAAGPMLPIVNDLYEQDEDDVFAIAAYVMSLKGGELPKAEQDAKAAEALKFAESVEWGNPAAPAVPANLADGAKVFEAQCTNCHKMGGKPAPLALSTTVNAPDPNNLILAVLQGIEPAPRGVLDRNMPARAIQINDEQMTALTAFVRARFSKQPAWTGVAEAVKAARAELK